MKSTFRILLHLRTSQLNKDGLATLMIRLTISRTIAEFSSKLRINPSLWDHKARRVKGKGKYATDMNHAIDNIRTRLHNSYMEILESNSNVTVELLRNHYLGIEEPKHSLIKLFEKKIKQKRALAGKSIQETAVDKYVCTLEKVKGFIQSHYEKADLPIKELAYDFITNFDIYLRSVHYCGHNTVVRHMRYLKQVTTDALKCRHILFDPFYDFELSSKKSVPKFLTEDELLIILNKKFESELLNQVRDFFIFCCFTGLAYIDVFKLRKQNIITKADGEQFIIKDRHKTGNESHIPLLEIPQMILKKYEDMDLPNGRLLPVNACQNMNIYIKEIAALCGINKNLSTHTARHTYFINQMIFSQLVYAFK